MELRSFRERMLKKGPETYTCSRNIDEIELRTEGRKGACSSESEIIGNSLVFTAAKQASVFNKVQNN